MRCWMFEETNKKMIPMRGEWAAIGTPPEPFLFDFIGWQEWPILKLTEYPSNPLEPIKDVSLLAKRIVQNREADVGINYLNSHELDLYSLAKAIQKAMVILGGE